MHFFKITFISLFLILTSCSKTNTVTHSDVNYFNLKEYFENEINSLQKENLKIERTARIDKKISVSTDANPDWENEFAVFKSFDISNPKIRDNYQADSVINENNKHLLYDNISGKGKVQSIHIILDENNIPTLIEVKTFEDGYFKKEDLTYSYQPSQAIGIMGTRKSLWADEMEYEVLNEIENK